MKCGARRQPRLEASAHQRDLHHQKLERDQITSRMRQKRGIIVSRNGGNRRVNETIIALAQLLLSMTTHDNAHSSACCRKDGAERIYFLSPHLTA